MTYVGSYMSLQKYDIVLLVPSLIEATRELTEEYKQA